MALLLSFWAALVPSLSSVVAQHPIHSFETACSAFASAFNHPGVKVQFSQFLPQGYNLSITDYPQSCLDSQGSSPVQILGADVCRVAILVDTSANSSMTLEAWLPKAWTGRFLSGGNGGLSGCIQYTDLSYGSSSGFATVSGNNGHNGSSGAPFYTHPEVLEDYSYRAIYVGSIVGKQIAQAFYGRDASKSYFMGCSGGGRQGFKLAQSFPEVFDGIIAAAPALDFDSFIAWGAQLSSIAGFDTNSTEFISESLWKAIHEEVLDQCDGLDGALDGIIEDTDLCHPQYERLICNETANDSSKCLTRAQVGKVRALYEPLYNDNGSLLYPKLQPGTETTSFDTYFSGTLSSLFSDWFKYVVYNPTFDTETLSREDLIAAASYDPYNISTSKSDLSAFERRGGKLLTLHGFEDNIIPTDISTSYYHRVSEAMSRPPSSLDEFYRYFRVSGLSHCALGNGAYSVGMYSFGLIPNAMEQDPDDNVLSRIVAWVERGEAPEYIRGTAFVGAYPGSAIAYKRKHCKYPATNKYVGQGSFTSENSWTCL
ncbi:putative feruloyl esterase [Paraphaeosphaeria sporulosa]|uniref:Carboxylic ester hydrolase n=1 Tax=Paraphaeosphaeria sporulosa TaxID=1460663 RepID=A0A177BT31_9PLEO|nr:putative feruloyl esterase [Paraphaeosphaeria sporulosa]OAF98543.1 putative feruloyl esterase [Paraphaeosphaeria sporulosa]